MQCASCLMYTRSLYRVAHGAALAQTPHVLHAGCGQCDVSVYPRSPHAASPLPGIRLDEWFGDGRTRDGKDQGCITRYSHTHPGLHHVSRLLVQSPGAYLSSVPHARDRHQQMTHASFSCGHVLCFLALMLVPLCSRLPPSALDGLLPLFPGVGPEVPRSPPGLFAKQ
jgi:hypothetical protein